MHIWGNVIIWLYFPKCWLYIYGNFSCNGNPKFKKALAHILRQVLGKEGLSLWILAFNLSLGQEVDMLMDHVSLELGDSCHITWERNTWKEEGGEIAAAMGGWGWDEGSSSPSCVSHQWPLSQQWQIIAIHCNYMNCNTDDFALQGAKRRILKAEIFPVCFVFSG